MTILSTDGSGTYILISDEYIRLRGVVRSADISADNLIESDRIAHADIKYIGAGQIADTAKQGWLRQAVTTISPY